MSGNCDPFFIAVRAHAPLLRDGRTFDFFIALAI
jgi:hypothetical protein